jgi:hypothetical protein
MLTLPLDVKITILENVPSKADLKALCLTSKELRDVAIPFLYHALCIHIWDKDDTTSFARSVASGAGRHLRHTRSLTFEDTRSPREPSTLQTGSFNFDRGPMYRPRDDHVRNAEMRMILSMFPDHCLRSFRYVQPI